MAHRTLEAELGMQQKSGEVYPTARAGQTPTPPPLQTIIAEYADASGKTNAQIAREAGFDRPNVIAMLRTGSMALPWKRAAALGRAIGCNPLYLLRRAMPPEDWSALVEVLGPGLSNAAVSPL